MTTIIVEAISGEEQPLSTIQEGNGVKALGLSDFTGDDVPEVVVVREDDKKHPQALVLFDLTAQKVLFELPYGDIAGLLGEEPIYYNYLEVYGRRLPFRRHTYPQTLY